MFFIWDQCMGMNNYISKLFENHPSFKLNLSSTVSMILIKVFTKHRLMKVPYDSVNNPYPISFLYVFFLNISVLHRLFTQYCNNVVIGNTGHSEKLLGIGSFLCMNSKNMRPVEWRQRQPWVGRVRIKQYYTTPSQPCFTHLLYNFRFTTGGFYSQPDK